MGREIKRVALNFEWPLNKVWKGYINPHGDTSVTCGYCEGRGWSLEYKHLHDLWYGFAEFKPEDRGSVPFTAETPAVRRLAEFHIKDNPRYYGEGEQAILDECNRLCKLYNSSWSHHLNQDDVDAILESDGLWDFTRVPRTKEQIAYVKRRMRTRRCNSWLPYNNGYRPIAAEVNAWSLGFMGHGGCAASAVISAECKRKGYPTMCAHCDGEGCAWPDQKDKEAYENWRPSEPPTGEGYQVWETVTEGSPVSPVFMFPNSLAEWMANRHPEHGNKEQWLKFIVKEGSVPTMISDGTQVLSGAAAAEMMEDDQEELPRMSILDEAAVLCLPLLQSRKRMRKWVRQARKAEAEREARVEARLREAA